MNEDLGGFLGNRLAQQRKDAARYLKAFDFSGLFADPSIGWDWPSSGKPFKVPSAQGFRELEVIAEKRGVKVLLVPPLANGTIMPSDERKKLEVAVTPLAAEHLLIFVDQEKTRQIWLWTSRLPGKPIRRRELNWEKARPDELTAIIGKNIQYLNGGIFAEHKIEKDNPKIQIPDEAFEKIFAFFDDYDWHLDDRPLANGNEINPEVLGYVFEKYTNQKEMGASYTKED